MKNRNNHSRSGLTLLKQKIKAVINKIFSIEDSPEKIARGFALGTFIGMTPLVGLQFLIAITIARFLKWNKIAAGMAVFNTNLLTGSFIFGFNYFIGASVIGNDSALNFSSASDDICVFNLLEMGTPFLCSFIVGGVITGIPFSILAYFLVKRIFRKKIKEKGTVWENTFVNEKRYALITGASQGLGKSLALELASRHSNLLLIALENEGLPDLCQTIRENYQVDAQCLEINLGKESAVSQIRAWLGNKPIWLLINNAGIGGSHFFDTSSLSYLDTIIRINIRTLALLTRALLPKLKRSPISYILNVASMASFCPIAYKTIYPASKAFVASFSLSLREELKNDGVSVSVLHPGPMPTNADVRLRIERHGKLEQLTCLSPEKVARIAINGLFNHKPIIVPGFFNRLNRVLVWLLPDKIKIPLVSSCIKRDLIVDKRLPTVPTTQKIAV